MIRFFRKNKNSYFEKIEELILGSRELNNIKNGYFLGGFVYCDNNYNELLDSIQNNNLESIFRRYTYNVNMDNLEVFYFENGSGDFYILIILDSFDYEQGEKILDIIKVKDVNISQIRKKEQIYP
ncbi:hypothetical protein EYV94_22860 [Puteibacter caeruleilacunae]|nr:hypothetical protein EYV94_22860 [Puteibacter caeruleilacunae]